MSDTINKDELIKKISFIKRKLADLHYNISKAYARSAFDIRPVDINKADLLKLLVDNKVSESYSMADKKYRLTDFETWKAIIAMDWSDKREYIYDIFDCDNFAFLFSARIADYFELNSAGTAFGSIYDKNTGKYIGEHAFNIIVTQENLGNKKIIVYEPMTDGYCEFEKGKDIIIGNWIYKPRWLIFF